MAFRGILILVVALASLIVFFQGGEHSSSTIRAPAALFQGTTFRDATEEELSMGVQVLGCSGSYVKNDAGKVLIMTAEHCLRWVNSCFDIKIAAHRTDIKGYCKQMLIKDKENDIVIFEAQLFDSNGRAYKPDVISAHCLADKPAKIGTRLQIFSFPAVPKTDGPAFIATIRHNGETSPPDQMQGKISENCEVTSEPEYCDKCTDQQMVQWENCAVFHAASGSAAIDLATNCAVGVTHAGIGTTDVFPSDAKAANVAVVSLFVEKNKSILKDLGVQIGSGALSLQPSSIQNIYKGAR